MRNRLLLLGAALAAFGASLVSGFHFDDYAIFSDPVLTSSSGWMGIWALRRTQPLTNLTFWLNYLVGGRDQAPIGNRDESMAPHGVFPAAGGDQWIAIAIASDDEFAKLCEALGAPS